MKRSFPLLLAMLGSCAWEFEVPGGDPCELEDELRSYYDDIEFVSIEHDAATHFGMSAEDVWLSVEPLLHDVPMTWDGPGAGVFGSSESSVRFNVTVHEYRTFRHEPQQLESEVPLGPLRDGQYYEGDVLYIIGEVEYVLIVSNEEVRFNDDIELGVMSLEPGLIGVRTGHLWQCDGEDPWRLDWSTLSPVQQSICSALVESENLEPEWLSIHASGDLSGIQMSVGLVGMEKGGVVGGYYTCVQGANGWRDE